MKLLPILTALIAMALPGVAQAQLEAENLLIAVPDGFIVGDAVQGGAAGTISATEFVPKGQTVQEWSEMVTVQVLHGATIGANALGEQVKTGWEGACPKSTVKRLGANKANGYSFVMWSYICPLNPQTKKPETMWLKAIRGGDALYVVQYAFRAAPTVATTEAALAYLDRVAVCDTRKPEHPCPKAK